MRSSKLVVQLPPAAQPMRRAALFAAESAYRGGVHRGGVAYRGGNYRGGRWYPGVAAVAVAVGAAAVGAAAAGSYYDTYHNYGGYDYGGYPAAITAATPNRSHLTGRPTLFPRYCGP